MALGKEASFCLISLQGLTLDEQFIYLEYVYVGHYDYKIFLTLISIIFTIKSQHYSGLRHEIAFIFFWIKSLGRCSISRDVGVISYGKKCIPLGFILFDPEIHLRKGGITLLEVESISGRWIHTLDETVGATPFYMRLNH